MYRLYVITEFSKDWAYCHNSPPLVQFCTHRNRSTTKMSSKTKPSGVSNVSFTAHRR